MSDVVGGTFLISSHTYVRSVSVQDLVVVLDLEDKVFNVVHSHLSLSID